MAQSIPAFLTGEGVTAIAIIPITSNPGSTITYDTSVSMTGKCESIELQADNELDPVQALDDIVASQLIRANGLVIRLNELLLSTSASAAGAGQFFVGATPYAKITFTRAGKTVYAIGVCRSYNETLARTGNKGTLELVMTQTDGGLPWGYS